MFGIYTILDVVRLLAAAVFAIGVHYFVVRPICEIAKDHENFRHSIENEAKA